MKPKSNDKKRLERTAKVVLEQLRDLEFGKPLQVLSKIAEIYPTETNGWAVKIGQLHGEQTNLEVWLDGFARHEGRKFSACFYSKDAKRIKSLANHAPDAWAIEKLDESHYEELDGHYAMKRKLAVKRFNKPFQEHYSKSNHHFFGIYHPSQVCENIDLDFVNHAVGFFSDALQALPAFQNEESSVLPKEENRRLRLHFAHERSRYLAARCKTRDQYVCQVCEMDFAKGYGDALGRGFAEAHHITALNSLGDGVETKVEDLVTVCANCHRMLHRMEGKKGDVDKLRKLVTKNKDR